MLEELEIFLEDCDDQLQLMENALVQMQEKGPDDNSIGAIFRAMHTIKGSAGMFGFDDVVTFAHTGENLLDCAREGKIEVTAEMVNLFLLCKDHLEKLIQAEVHEEEVEAAEKAVGADLIEKLVSYMPQADSCEVNFTKPAKPVTMDEMADLSPATDKSVETWHISIRFHEDFFTTGMSIHSIFNFFNKMGKVLINQPILYNIPLLQELNPLHPYIGFELLLQADTTEEEIEDVFEFVSDDVDVIILDASSMKDPSMLVARRQEPELQKTLIDAGFYDAAMFQSDEVAQDEPEPKPAEQESVAVRKTSPTPVHEGQHDLQKSGPAKQKKPSSSLRVDSEKIDLLINSMSEMVIANSKIINLVEQEENTELEEATYRMKELLENVRDGIMDMRMVQVGDSFNKFRRIVNDISKKIGKDVQFVISGAETELDKTVIERISDPLVHMLRNSIDHGIELPEERVAKGKPATGRVDLRAYPDAGTIVIEIEDDGKGLDKDKILAKAIENGQVDPKAKLSDTEIYKLIFAAGLSTAEKVSDISGRGVGMDVVRKNIEDLRGTVEIDSTLHKGSKITIRLPLTLAIIDGFLVQVGDTKYIIPLESIQECKELTAEERESMKGNEFINLRGEMLPLMDVREVLKEGPNHTNRQNIVIVYFGDKTIGLLVDELLGEHQTVIKSLGDMFENVQGVSGGSILGSGEIALIFDIARLIDYKATK